MEEVEIMCPICREHKIKALHRPKCFGEKFSHAGSNRCRVPQLYEEKYIVMTSCKCGATKKQIARIFREGKSVLATEAAKRMKAQGLPTRF